MDSGKAVDALLKEYEDLRQNSRLHKESLRKIHLIAGTAISAVIGSLRLGEVATTAVVLLFPPFALITIAFALQDLYQIFVIAKHAAALEDRVNHLLGRGDLLTWETRTCRLMFGALLPRVGRTKLILWQPSLIGTFILLIFGIPAFVYSIYRSVHLIPRIEVLAAYVGALAIAAVVLVIFGGRIVTGMLSGELEDLIQGQYLTSEIDREHL